MDALNFYYGIAKPLAFKWIDINSLLHELLHSHLKKKISLETIVFTGIVSGDAGKRQAIYLHALKEHTQIKIVKGQFKTRYKYQELVEDAILTITVFPQVKKFLLELEKRSRLM